jgi:hypothetical protein
MNYIKDTLDYLAKIFQWWILIQPWERGVRTRFGNKTKLLIPGTHFRIPFFDIIYIQTIRLRVVSMSPQTVSTKDGKTVTISCAIGYAIDDIMKLYNTLYQPEVTICNMVQGHVAEYIFSHDLLQCNPEDLTKHITEKMKDVNHGIKYEYVKVVSYAVVRTYRLIQDSSWVNDTLNMTERH